MELLDLNNIPGGQWVIHALVEIEDDNAAPQAINCELFLVGANIVLDARNAEVNNAGDGDRMTQSLQDVQTTRPAGTDDARIRCTNPTADADADNLSIIATRVNN